MVHLQDILTGLQKQGIANVTGLVINHPGAADSVARFADHTALPVLQDVAGATPGGTVWDLYGANKDYLFVADPNGFIRAQWPLLDLSVNGDKLEQAIWAARVD